MNKFLLCAVFMHMSLSVHAGSTAPALICPPLAQSQMDNEFGAGTSAQTHCLQKRKGVKSVINMSSAALHKSGKSQQIVNVKNMLENYQGMYGMEINDDFAIVGVGHGAGERWLLTDAAYNRTFSVTTGNPSRAMVESLVQSGVAFFMCQNTMRGSGWKTEDVLPGVKQTPAGATAAIDFAKLGFVLLTP